MTALVRFSDLYTRFEDEFRGAASAISARQSIYLPLLDLVPARDREQLRAIDIGSGRGEWLKLLRERGWTAYGVEPNESMAAISRHDGLEIIDDDGLAFLRAQPDGSAALITAFHVVEHVEIDYLLSMLFEIERVLAPSGILILETPNVENVTVGTTTFHLDPTHTKPLPPALLKFLVSAAGLPDAAVVRMNGLVAEPGTPAAEAVFNLLFQSAMDYAVVAQKHEGHPEVSAMAAFAQGNSQPGAGDHAALRERFRNVDEQQARLASSLQRAVAQVGACLAASHQLRSDLGASRQSITDEMNARLGELDARIDEAARSASADTNSRISRGLADLVQSGSEGEKRLRRSQAELNRRIRGLKRSFDGASRLSSRERQQLHAKIGALGQALAVTEANQRQAALLADEADRRQATQLADEVRRLGDLVAAGERRLEALRAEHLNALSEIHKSTSQPIAAPARGLQRLAQRSKTAAKATLNWPIRRSLELILYLLRTFPSLKAPAWKLIRRFPKLEQRVTTFALLRPPAVPPVPPEFGPNWLLDPDPAALNAWKKLLRGNDRQAGRRR